MNSDNSLQEQELLLFFFRKIDLPVKDQKKRNNFRVLDSYRWI